MWKSMILLTVFALLGVAARATIFGGVRGVVHDPQHRPIQDAVVTLKAADSDWMQSQKTNDSGEFEFTTVPLGNYTVTAAPAGFQMQQQAVTVKSDTNPVLHFELTLATVNQSAVVSGAPVEASTDSVTPTTLLSREDIQTTPGADRTNSMAMITDNVPGAYMVHDQLHIRGGHQVSWLIDGVPVPNTNIASNVGPQFDPKDVDYIEVQRGSYDAGYGDRTYGVFNVVPRTGFERNSECDVVLSYGNYNQTNDQMNCGGHNQKLAYFGSLNANRNDLGLETPVAQIIHDSENGYGGFGSLIFNADPKNQLRLVTSLRKDYYQIPISPDDEAAGNILVDGEHEADSFVNFSWVRTFTPSVLLTVSPFYHFNSANYDSAPYDFPVATTDHRSSSYAGIQATLQATVARNEIQVGTYDFAQHDNQLFGLLINDGSSPSFQQREIVSGRLESLFLEDKFAATSWLTLSGGMRQTFFSSSSSENATSPRAGVALRVPRLGWVFRGFYGQFYQAPPLLTAAGPLLDFVNSQNLAFIPLHGELDTEVQFGVTIPYKTWSLDVDTFRTRAHNFFDHNNVGNSNIFFPLTIDEALIRGWELTLRTPRLWRSVQAHVAYSNQIALARGGISGGLTDFSPPSDYFTLDHDQRNTLNVGFDVKLPRAAFVAGNVYYGSGFSNGNPPPDHLPGHATLDLSIGKAFGERFSVALSGLNVTNSHLLIDNSFTFGGVHFNNPFEVYAEVRYRFHY